MTFDTTMAILTRFSAFCGSNVLSLNGLVMDWHRLDREKTIGMINSVKSAAEALLFSPVSSEAKCTRLPFYDRFLLYRLTNYSSLPTFSMDFISDGEKFIYLDGSDAPIHTVNQIGGLTLTPDTVIPYLNFYFLNVRLPEGEVIILKAPEEAGEIGVYDDERREDILLIPECAKIEKDEETGDLKVTAPIYYDGVLMEALMTVGAEGGVMVQPQKMMAQQGLQ